MIVWKYPIPHGNGFITLQMPAGALSLSVAYQAKTDSGCLWALIDPAITPRPHRFYVVATGITTHGAIGKLPFIGSWELPTPEGWADVHGETVWHLFDAGDE